MPLHRIFHPVGAFSAAEKQALAASITNIYSANGIGLLPDFYVVVIFTAVDTESFFVGGQPSENFIRIVAYHFARHLQDLESKKRWSDKYEAALAPHIKARGYDWEVHLEESPAEMWRENGLIPPKPNSPAEKEWIRLNKPVPYDGPSIVDSLQEEGYLV